MNASNLTQLRPQPRSRNPSSEQFSPTVCGNLDDGVSPNMVTFNRDRRGSGSYRGAYESDDDIAFKGVDTSPGYEPLGTSQLAGCPNEEKMKRKLKFYFMNPVDKFYATRKIPWKLFLQILKVFIVTAQLWVFAEYRYAHVNYYTDQTVSFEHFFIKDWDQVREVHAYPPSTGKLALYRKSDFFIFVDFVVSGLKTIEDDALGPFFRNSSLGLCVEHYKAGNVSRDLNFVLDNTLESKCIFLAEKDLFSYNHASEWMEQNDLTMPWPAVESMVLNFSLTSVTLRPLGPVPTPDCFKFNIKIKLDNHNHDGQIPMSLDMEPVRLECPSQKELTSSYSKFIVFLNLLVIMMSLS